MTVAPCHTPAGCLSTSREESGALAKFIPEQVLPGATKTSHISGSRRSTPDTKPMAAESTMNELSAAVEALAKDDETWKKKTIYD